MIGRKLGLAALMLLYYMLGGLSTKMFDMSKRKDWLALGSIVFVLTVVTLYLYT